jgi:hypothetical protein
MTGVDVSPLLAEDIDQAVLLVGLGSPSPDPVLLRDDILGRIAKPGQGGVLLARGANRRSCGVLMYRIATDPEPRVSLQVDRLIAFDLTQPRSIAGALVREVIRLGRLRHCDCLRLDYALNRLDDPTPMVLRSDAAVLACVL